MHILISNDDGLYAPGIRLLSGRLGELCDRVTVVAPDRDRSGASNSLTLDQPIRVEHQDDGRYKIYGTPTDCVHLAITGLLETEPDMVVSGINAGANLGDDVLYSGTVAAAMEGRFLGLPAMAVSLVYVPDGPHHYKTAAEAAAILMQRLLSEPLPADTILNVNVPDLPWEEIRGFETTRLGHRHCSGDVIPIEDPRGRPFFWVGPPGSEEDNGPGTDFHAVRNGYVSVTPIHVDLTRYQALEQVSNWIESLNRSNLAEPDRTGT
ncbi:5'/3'-nucleotidase SurE [Wenzhouxiangella limi]|uniref:5'-nucleotidase SurE n=1 Tax=Wenzhouxiangella limi TaxID=2707351 RepID=A0A845UV73_9GAMM|nr:5'/3'-nucleotidase SurE [Wenzhouxiangella limi]NDY95387.1 5'/3'-nucleotidase SurE [Wenzhouxiangella limi]